MKRTSQRAHGDEVWLRWQRGERVGTIARALGLSHTAIGKRLRRLGGFAPVARCRSRYQLS